MTIEEKLETKEKVLKAAADLFSKSGFEGTSVRDIAHEAGVNIAAINYHFSSKHNLYWAVVDQAQSRLSEGIGELAKAVDSVEELTVRAYKFLMEDPAAIRTTFKMLLSDAVPPPDGEVGDSICAEGPPGASHFVTFVRKHAPPEASDVAIYWAVKAIFSSLFHFALLSSSTKIEMMRQKHPDLNEAGISFNLKIHAKAICEYLGNHHEELTKNAVLLMGPCGGR